jgi:uncharacterized protein with HEPN domain
MTRHSDKVYLRHMLDHVRAAMRLAANRSRADLDADEALRYALIHLVCITGEAAMRVSEPERRLHPEIPWGAAKGMRNWLVHGYDVVDLSVVWDTVTSDFPSLAGILERLAE